MNNGIECLDGKPPGFTLEIDRTAKILLVTWLGKVTYASMREGFETTRRFARGRELHGAISDFSQIESFELSANDIYALTKEDPVFETEIPRITVSGADHVFGTARMFQLMSDRRTGIHVVRTMQEAYALLRLDDAEFLSPQVA